MKKYISLSLIVFLLVALFPNSTYAYNFIGGSENNPIEWRTTHFDHPNGLRQIRRPIAQFRVQYTKNGERTMSEVSRDKDGSNGDVMQGIGERECPEVYTTVGDTIDIIDKSSSREPGYPLKSMDLQIDFNDGSTQKTVFVQKSIPYVGVGNIIKSFTADKLGCYIIYLNVVDSTPNSTKEEQKLWTWGAGNFSVNGNHRVKGIDKNGNYGWWYFSTIRIYTQPPNPTVHVQHINDDTKEILDDYSYSSLLGATISESCRTYTGLAYDYSAYSYDNGTSWRDKNTEVWRNVTIEGDTLIQFHYSNAQRNVKVIHVEKSTGKILEQKQYTVAKGTKVIEESKSFSGLDYADNVISVDDGATWSDLSTATKREIVIEKNTVIKFEYVDVGSIQAILTMTANPSSIEKGKTSPVVFTLDASQSIGKNIVKYEFTYTDPDSNKIEKTETVSRTNVNNTRVYPNTWHNGKVIITDDKGRTSEATAKVLVGEYIDMENADVQAMLRLDSNDEKVVAKEGMQIRDDVYRAFEITVRLPKNTLNSGGNYSLDLKMNAIESTATNGVGTYKYSVINHNTEIESKNPVENVTISDMSAIETNIMAQVTVNDSVVTSKTSTWYESINIKYLPELIPPDVQLAIKEPNLLMYQKAEFTPTFIENEDTFAITDKDWEIKTFTGNTILSGQGEIPQYVYINDDFTVGYYEAIQYIYYVDDDGITQKDSDTVIFNVRKAIPIAEIKANMTLKEGVRDITNRVADGKQYKQINISIASSETATPSYIQNAYPINWSSEKTVFTIEKIDNNYNKIKGGMDKVYAYSASDLSLNDDKLTFTARKAIDLRFDDFGVYRIQAKVYNDYYESEWVTSYINVIEDLPPKVNSMIIANATFDTERNMFVDYRDPEDGLKTSFVVSPRYIKGDDDEIDANSAKLTVSYDENQDGNFTNDGVYSNQIISKYTNPLSSISAFDFSYDAQDIFVTVDNTQKNILGLFRFNCEIGEIPTIPNYLGGDLPSVPSLTGNSSSIDNKFKTLLIDNTAPIITVSVGKKSKFEVWIFEMTDNPNFDYNVIKSWYEDDVILYIMKKDGSIERR